LITTVLALVSEVLGCVFVIVSFYLPCVSWWFSSVHGISRTDTHLFKCYFRPSGI